MKKAVTMIGIATIGLIPAVAHFVDGYAIPNLWLPAVCGIVLGVGIVAFAQTSID